LAKVFPLTKEDIMLNGDRLERELMARRENWNDGISIYMRQITVGDGTMVAAPVSMVKHGTRLMYEPMLVLDVQLSQKLMDELWQCGVRPSEGSGSAGQLAAVKYHLEDMRNLVFKKD
jgi:hypothetical protein